MARKPDYPDAFYMIGTVLKQQGAMTEAVPHFKQAIRYRPLSAEAHRSLGQALGQLGDPAAPQRSSPKPIGSTAEPPTRRPRLSRSVSACRSRKRTTRGAIAHFRDAIRLADDNPQAHYQLALALRARRAGRSAGPLRRGAAAGTVSHRAGRRPSMTPWMLRLLVVVAALVPRRAPPGDDRAAGPWAARSPSRSPRPRRWRG